MGTDATLAERERTADEINARARAVGLLREAQVPFVVGGAYAYATYTGIYRDTKDLDLFPRKADALRALEVLEQDGWRTERTDEVWLYKAFKGDYFVDFIFSSGNGVAVVDDEWFQHAKTATVFGHECLVAPAEEMIWSKAFVIERERYDGADVNHLILKAGPAMDWERLLRRFDRYWEVLLSHLMLFRFTYPSERDIVPDWVMAELMRRTLDSIRDGHWAEKLCRGNLVSKVNYHVDIHHWGFQDGRAWDENERQQEGDGGARPGFESSVGGGR
ncbi:nucleotidyltransferase family protein [Myxococcus sp. K15C18031901]|nr:nucleotidyltransferase [Myxococcus dinghuensis]MCP3103873.1 nucleotidyltransferase family protein [Myxococcus dinghuensis]